MNKEDEDLLEKNGWVIECENPFEISQADDPYKSRATGYAAECILAYEKICDKMEN